MIQFCIRTFLSPRQQTDRPEPLQHKQDHDAHAYHGFPYGLAANTPRVVSIVISAVFRLLSSSSRPQADRPELVLATCPGHHNMNRTTLHITRA